MSNEELNVHLQVNNQDYYYNTQPKWWNKDCQTLKSLKNYALIDYRVTNDEINYQIYRWIRNQFKAKCQLNLKIYEKNNVSKLVESRNNVLKLVESRNNVSEFWKLIKGSTIQKLNNMITTGDK